MIGFLLLLNTIVPFSTVLLLDGQYFKYISVLKNQF